MKPTDLTNLSSDLRVVSESEAAAFCSLSLAHFRRLRREQKGPKHVRLSVRRIGYRIRDLLHWVNERIC